jgi:NADPH:quinone reductase-like Zn-dependent oxidoreductase
MRAVRFHQYGDPNVLVCEEVPDPQPGPGDVRIRVRACAVNHVDLDLRSGTSRFPLTLPHTLGTEVAGDVDVVGQGVPMSLVGQRSVNLHTIPCGTCEWCRRSDQNICDNFLMTGITLPGGYAEYVVVPASSLIPIPDDVTYVEAACIQSTFGTAWHALVPRAALQSEEFLLVNAAGGGVGSSGVQIGKYLGATVIATAGSGDKAARALSLGADRAIDYSTKDWPERVMDITHGRGVDVALESVGGDIFTESLGLMAKNGRLVTVGAHGGEVVEVDLIPLFRRQISVLGSPRATPEEYRHVIELVGEGAFRPVIDHVYDLADAAQAHERLERRATFGRVVLQT